MPSSFSSLRKNLEAVVIRVEDAFDDGLLEKSPSLFISERIRARGGGRRDAEERSVVFGLTSFATVLSGRPLRARHACIRTSNNATPRDDGGKFALPSIHFGSNWDSKHAPRGYETGIRARGIWSDDARETRIRTSSPLYGHVTLFRSVLGSSVVPSVRGVFHMRVHLLRMV